MTGIGHHTDRAVILGLLGHRPDTIKVTSAKQALQQTIDNHLLNLAGSKEVIFNYDTDILFHSDNLPLHENGMSIIAYDSESKPIFSETYYSIGGGFIATEQQMLHGKNQTSVEVPFPFANAEQLLDDAEKTGLSLASLILRNEICFQPMAEIEQKAEQIWKVMQLCMQRGFETEGILDGGLNVTRRAPNLQKKLESNHEFESDPMAIMDWVNLFAFAVSEENAAGGQVVTSPTNGAAGVIPAVLMYYHKFIRRLDTKQLKDFLAVAGAIGILYKMNARSLVLKSAAKGKLACHLQWQRRDSLH
ncbi:L-serine dehydratase [Vibrio ponticus]|nr:L-serine dehydratase [Vibrio ponticus]